MRGAKEQGIVLEAVKDFRSVTAGGVAGVISGRAVLIGKLDFLRNEKLTSLEALEASAVKLQEEGKTTMFVVIDGKPASVHPNELVAPHDIGATAERFYKRWCNKETMHDNHAAG